MFIVILGSVGQIKICRQRDLRGGDKEKKQNTSSYTNTALPSELIKKRKIYISILFINTEQYLKYKMGFIAETNTIYKFGIKKINTRRK